MRDVRDAAHGIKRPGYSFWKAIAAGVLAGLVVPALFFLPSAHAAAVRAENAKILIVYYSRTGNTGEIARQIQAKIGGDIVEIQTVEPYPDDYRATTRQAQEELNSGYKPPLKTKVENIASYDIIFVGSPNWWGTIATPVMSFLSQHKVSGKTIIPFITHEGSRLGRSSEDIAALCPDSRILEGLAVRGGSAKTAQNEVAAWLRKLEMEKSK